MTRYRFTIEYYGAPFSGWQRQDDRSSVQGAVEAALARLGEPGPIVQGAGRTDAGVHALGQVGHSDLMRPWKPFRLMEALNAQLRDAGDPVAILDCEEADKEFHARFSAITRRYVYRILPRRAPLTVEAGLAWNVKQELDVSAMHQAAQLLVGEHDFTTFRSTECQAKSPVKTVSSLEVRKIGTHGSPVIEIESLAQSFLHNQVRSFAGALKEVGTGKWSASDLRASLEARDRTACAPVAPPHGLYLVAVNY
ncbi:MAG: tRNA pseudouridine(38-40) synthase TruA [Rhizobiaceae bacterium]